MKTSLLLSAFLIISALTNTTFAAVSLLDLKGNDVISGKATQLSLTDKKGVVTVFLSAVCPCSNSHIKEISELAKKYPEYSFIGVHSNVDEASDMTKKYFQEAALPFPVIQDEKAQIADKMGAFKTPHVFVTDKDGKILYQGGVSNSHVIENSDRKFLREALADLAAQRAVRTPEGRTLGCVISRGEKNVW